MDNLEGSHCLTLKTLFAYYNLYFHSSTPPPLLPYLYFPANFALNQSIRCARSVKHFDWTEYSIKVTLKFAKSFKKWGLYRKKGSIHSFHRLLIQIHQLSLFLTTLWNLIQGVTCWQFNPSTIKNHKKNQYGYLKSQPMIITLWYSTNQEPNIYLLASQLLK